MIQEAVNPQQRILLVLGQNWEKGIPLLTKKHGTRRKLSRASIQTTQAAEALINSGNYDTVIFSTGHTNGPDQPSEADAMADLLNSIDPAASQKATILRETNSYDTPTNIHEVLKLLKQEGLTNPRLTVVAPHYHMRRVTIIAKKLGLPIAENLETETVLGIQPEKTPIWEYVLRPLARLDAEGTIPRIITGTRRKTHRLFPSRARAALQTN